MGLGEQNSNTKMRKCTCDLNEKAISRMLLSKQYTYIYNSKYKKVDVLAIRIVSSNVSSIGPSSETFIIYTIALLQMTCVYSYSRKIQYERLSAAIYSHACI